MHRIHWRASAVVVAAASLVSAGTLAASPAFAVDLTPTGPITDLQITPDLNCAVSYAGDSDPEFYGDTACGTLVAVSDSSGSTLYGPASIPAGGSASPRTPFTPVSQTTTGSGTSASPLKITTVADAGSDARVTQIDTYVNGQNDYATTTTVAPKRSGVTLKTFYGGDCYLGNDDRGFGDYTSSTGAITCRNAVDDAPGPRIEQFIPTKAGSSYYYGFYDSMWAAIGAQDLGDQLVNPTTLQDNGIALEWTGAAGASLTTSRLTNFSEADVRALTTTVALPATASAGSVVTESFSISNPNTASQTVTGLDFALPTGATYVAGSSLPASIGTPTQSAGTLTYDSDFSVPAGGTVNGSFRITLGSATGSLSTSISGSAPPAPVIGASTSITVTAVTNQTPVANPQTISTPENTSTPIVLSGSDAENDPLTYSVGRPSHGTLTGTAPNLTYTPAAGYTGADSFTFTVNDGHSTSTPATVSITVTAPANVPPTADNVSVTTTENTPKAVVLLGSDANGDALTYTVGTPSHGTLSGTAPNLTYTPTAGYTGADSFTYTVSDGQATSAPGTVSITVKPASGTVNRAPIAHCEVVLVKAGSSVRITLKGTDADGDALTYSHSSAHHGSLSGSGKSLVYTPARGFKGIDAFTYTVNDGHVTSARATVLILVYPNHRPWADPQHPTTWSGRSVSVVLHGGDQDGDTVTYAAGAAKHGTVVLHGRTATYVPNAGYTGNDSFTFTASDGSLTSAPATVAVTVRALH